jgi:hypothetical protein
MKIALILTFIAINLFTFSNAVLQSDKKITHIQIFQDCQYIMSYTDAILLTERSVNGDNLEIKLKKFNPSDLTKQPPQRSVSEKPRSIHKSSKHTKNSEHNNSNTLQVPDSNKKNRLSFSLTRSKSSSTPRQDPDGQDNSFRLTKTNLDVLTKQESVELSKSSEYVPPGGSEKAPILPQSLNPSQQGEGYFLNLDYRKITKLRYGENKKKETNTPILKIEFYDNKPYTIKIFFVSGKFKSLKDFIDEVTKNNNNKFATGRVNELINRYIQFSIKTVNLNRYIAKFEGMEAILKEINLEEIEFNPKHMLYKYFDENEEFKKDEKLREAFNLIHRKAAKTQILGSTSTIDYMLNLSEEKIKIGDSSSSEKDLLDNLDNAISQQQLVIKATTLMGGRKDLWEFFDQIKGNKVKKQ